MQTKDYFSYIRDFDHKLGIYLTFTLDKEVINKIRENSSGRTIVLHDYRQGISLDESWKNRVLFIPFYSQSLTNETCFHSKLALLKGKEQARLLIGSMNLSKSSFSGLKEVCYSIDLDYSSSLYREIIEFLRKIPLKLYKHHWVSILDELSIINRNEVYNRKPLEPLFISNLDDDTSIARTFQKHVKALEFKDRPILRIATPFLSKHYGDSLIEFIDLVQPRATFLYIRDKTRVTDEFIRNYGSNIRIVRPKAAKKTFHAKMIMLEYRKKALLYIGSANFTKQGFFLSFKESGNLETGLLIMVLYKKDLLDWFTKGWGNPVDIVTWNRSATDIPKEEFSLKSYAWGEKIKDNLIEVYLLLSNPDLLRRAKIDGKKVRFEKIDNNLFKSKVVSTKNIITINLQPEEDDIKFHVFDSKIFENAKRDDGESLFSIDNRILEETVREVVLKEELAKKGIKIGSKGVTIVEPPLLEQFYYNAKHLIKLIQKKKYFDESHLRELKAELQKQHGASGAYLTMHLYKIFKQKKLNEFSILCESKLDELFRSFSYHPGKYKPFVNKWIIPNA